MIFLKYIRGEPLLNLYRCVYYRYAEDDKICSSSFRIYLKNFAKTFVLYYDNCMLPKDFRLKKRSAFTATYRTGKTLHKDGITMFIGKEKQNEFPTKVGFVVRKKIHKRAVKRNRIKRLMRESYRLLIKDGAVSDKYLSIIFVASSKLLDKDFKYIDNAIRKLVYKL